MGNAYLYMTEIH